MKHTVKVTIERHDDCVIVSNDKGKSWNFQFKNTIGIDMSAIGAVADIASALLTGTIVSHLKEINSPKITYTLSVDQ